MIDKDLKISKNFCRKARIKAIGKPLVSLKVKSILLWSKISKKNFSKSDANCVKNYGKCEQKQHNSGYYSQKFQTSITPWKKRNLKNLLDFIFYAELTL